ncbi:MAG: penicillin-binding transpeptidase domain-containing protein [Candidatus Velthaea sp.]
MLFVLLFALLAARQAWIMLVDAPALAADPHNPRHLQLATGRGTIVARDGTPLAITRGDRRVYPLGASAAHAVGYASGRYGTTGLEDSFNGVLAARSDTSTVLAQIGELVAGNRASPRGSDVVTTLDVDIQRALVANLLPYRRAAAVVLDPRTGAVLALASVLAFDPNRLERDFPKLVTDQRSPLLDRSTVGLYPPGSTFKVVTAADALDAGVVTPQTTFVDRGGLAIGNFVVRNDEEETTGTQTLVGAFALSSNVDFAQIGLRLGVNTWFDYAKRWGLGDSLAFDVPAARDRIPRKAEVSNSILAQLAFGQASLLVTPLRMALVAATIANNGVTPRPFLVRSIAGHDTTLATRPEQLAAPISAETAHEVRDMMIEVVRRGTGTAAALPGVTVAGKTGTATNPHGRSHAWFVAFAPAEMPRVAIAVVIENVGYGGTYAAPIAKRVLRVALAKERS